MFICLLALCSSPSNPSNGAVTSAGNSVGDTATYSCNTGFELIGNAVATCSLDTDGNSASFMPTPPVCRGKSGNDILLFQENNFLLVCSAMCSSPSSPSNGRVTSTGNSVGDTATYTCNTGFELIGSRVATCRQAGNSASFSPAPPVCRRKYTLIL